MGLIELAAPGSQSRDGGLWEHRLWTVLERPSRLQPPGLVTTAQQQATLTWR